MAISPPRSPELELELLRRSVGALVGERTRCADCRRTPLVGERVHRYEGDRFVCELCHPLRRGESLGSHLVLGGEHGRAVRIVVRRTS